MYELEIPSVSHLHNLDTIPTMVIDANETTRKGGGLRLSANSEMNSQLSFGMVGCFIFLYSCIYLLT